MRDREPTAFEKWDALFTDEVIDAAIAYHGLPGRGSCTDPDTLRSAALVQVTVERRIAAEAAEDAEDDDGPDAA